MSTTSEFTLRAPGVTIREVIDAEDLAAAEAAALAWGAEVGAAEVEIFDGEPDGAAPIKTVIVAARDA